MSVRPKTTCPNSCGRKTLCGAFALALIVVWLAAGCAQSPTAPADPTATYVPPPTATSEPKATPVMVQEELRSFPRAEISIDGSTLVYDGIIDQPSYDHFRRIVAASDAVIKTIQIRSNGGADSDSLRMGEWIYAQGLDVVVDDYCYSACANYIFTSGRNKVIGDGAVVGWHGSNLTSEFVAKNQGITMEEQLKRNFDAFIKDAPFKVESSAHYQALFNQYKRSFLRRVDEEREFLEEIGVNPELLTYGFLSEQDEAMHDADNRHFSLWTFSIEDMEKFGVNNVSYEGDGEYPSESTLERYSYIVVLLVPD